jgi:hypothetical protein
LRDAASSPRLFHKEFVGAAGAAELERAAARLERLDRFYRDHRPCHELHTPHTELIGFGLVSAAPPTSIRERLASLKSDVLEVARRHGASNLRVDGSIAKGLEHERSDLDLLVDLSPEHSLLGG